MILVVVVGMCAQMFPDIMAMFQLESKKAVVMEDPEAAAKKAKAKVLYSFLCVCACVCA